MLDDHGMLPVCNDSEIKTLDAGTATSQDPEMAEWYIRRQEKQDEGAGVFQG